MNKKEFINKLSSYLGGIPGEDRQDVQGRAGRRKN